MTEREALKLALEALEGLIKKTSGQSIYSFMETERRIAMSACVGIKEVLAQPEQEPAYRCRPYSSVPNAKVSEPVDYYTTPPQRKPLTDEHTTFVQRFTDAVAILCGAEPPAKFVDEWLCNVDVDGVHRLQEWVLNQDATPPWSQGIVVLDAAYLLAESPAEGLQHEAARGIKGDA